MSDNDHEGHFYKGLFYGLVVGLGLAWFLGTKEGKKVKDEVLEQGEALLEKAEGKLEENLIDTVENPQE
ncbi:MAG TPA: YtxH domain-containing protein [Candidatus Nanoarchaeia archaeon]